MARKRQPASDDLTRRIGHRLAELRKHRGIAQNELAKLLGITQPHVSRYESGTLRLHGDLIVRLTQILGVSADELLGIKPAGKRGPIRGVRFLQRLERINGLPKRDRDALARIINGFLSHTTHAEASR